MAARALWELLPRHCRTKFENNAGRKTKEKAELGTRLAFRLSLVERMTGIEPAFPAWEAGALPLDYIRIGLSEQVNFPVLAYYNAGKKKSQCGREKNFPGDRRLLK